MSLRTGIGVQLKDIKVFNRDRQQGKQGISLKHLKLLLYLDIIIRMKYFVNVS